MRASQSWLIDEIERRGVTRRELLAFLGATAAWLATSPAEAEQAAGRIEAALAKIDKPRVIWLELQDCAGCTESFLRAEEPRVADLVLDVLSVDYHETLMAAAGRQAESALSDARKKGEYIAVVEGAIPLGAGGAYCTIGGRSALDRVHEITADAAVTIAVGSCAAFGGLPAAKPNPTDAVGVDDAVRGLRNLVNLPGCPVNAANLVALLVHYLTFKKLPALDAEKRPLFAYGKTIHDACERRAHFDAGQFVRAWGDEAHRAGQCLYEMGCKGPATHHNCPDVRWNGGTSWPIGCGHPCIGCAEPGFWDRMAPFYAHLTGFGGGIDIDKVGLVATAAVGGGLTAHGLVRLATRIGKKSPAVPAPAVPAPAVPAPAAPDVPGPQASPAEPAPAAPDVPGPQASPAVPAPAAPDVPGPQQEKGAEK